MLRMRKIVGSEIVRASSLVALFVTLAPTQIVHEIPGIYLGPPMKNVALSGSYLEAVRIAYNDWGIRTKHKVAIEDQTVTITPVPGRENLVYVRFLPKPAKEIIPGCASRYGIEVLYMVDERKNKIVKTELDC